MRNKLVDLNNHLFAQMERLSDEELTGEALQEEVLRAEMVSKIGKEIIDNASLALKVEKARRDLLIDTELPVMLESK